MSFKQKSNRLYEREEIYHLCAIFKLLFLFYLATTYIVKHICFVFISLPFNFNFRGTCIHEHVVLLFISLSFYLLLFYIVLYLLITGY